MSTSAEAKRFIAEIIAFWPDFEPTREWKDVSVSLAMRYRPDLLKAATDLILRTRHKPPSAADLQQILVAVEEKSGHKKAQAKKYGFTSIAEEIDYLTAFIDGVRRGIYRLPMRLGQKVPVSLTELQQRLGDLKAGRPPREWIDAQSAGRWSVEEEINRQWWVARGMPEKSFEQTMAELRERVAAGHDPKAEQHLAMGEAILRREAIEEAARMLEDKRGEPW